VRALKLHGPQAALPPGAANVGAGCSASTGFASSQATGTCHFSGGITAVAADVKCGSF
jgi:hypothetical protein